MTVKVTIMVRLAVDPVLGMVLDPFVNTVLFVPGTNETGV